MERLTINRLFGVAVLGFTQLSAAPLPGADQRPEAPSQRGYEAGSLTASDYRAVVPEEDGGLDASTTTDLQYHYRYQTRVMARRVTAWTTEITVDAVVLPAKSWNRRPGDLRLLDHEQGHFDLTYIAALQARLHFARERRISNTAANSDEAIRRLEDDIQREMQRFVDAVLIEHEKYDRITRHGLDPQTQQQQRKIHREQIARLTQQLQADGEQGTRSRANAPAPEKSEP